MTNGAHLGALKRRLDWLTWARDPRSQPDIKRYGIEEVMPECIFNMEHGDTYFMDRHFCDMVDQARRDMPEDVEFDETWMQSRNGFLVCETPFEVPNIVEFHNMLQKMVEEEGVDPEKLKFKPKIHAIGWNWLGDDRYKFYIYLDMPRSESGFSPWSYFRVGNGVKLSQRIDTFEDSSKPNERYDNNELHEMRWVYAAMNLMSQKIASTHKEAPPKATIRRALKKKHSPPREVKVVTLRRFREDQAKESKGDVNWRWRWVVRGHWRMQPYKDGTVKPIFIESFVKGPDDKPLKNPGHLMFVAAR